MGNKEELVVKYAILGLKDGIDKDYWKEIK